jgi:hypothetical protein
MVKQVFVDSGVSLTFCRTKRIWTYQEILLATCPVVVCGNHHIPWSQFSFSMVFLNNISHQFVHDTRLNSATIAWIKLIVTKCNVAAQTRELEYTKLTTLSRYEQFIRSAVYRFNQIRIISIASLITASVILCFAFGLLLGFGVLSGVGSFSSAGSKGKSTTPRKRSRLETLDRQRYLPILIPVAVVALVLVVLLPLLAFQSFIASNLGRGALLVPRVSLVRPLSRVGGALDDIVNAIATRQATNQKDLAFGVRPVLEVLSKQSLPIPDYALSVDEVYKRFAADLVRSTKQLKILIVASLTHQPGQPSWVPNWQVDIKNHMFWLNQDLGLISFLVNNSGTTAAPPPRPWAVETENWTLRVRGHRVCEVTSLVQLTETSESYREDEDPLHIKNLSSIINLFSLESGISLVYHLGDRENHPHQARAASEEALDAYKQILQSYARGVRGISASRVFSFLKQWRWRGGWFRGMYIKLFGPAPAGKGKTDALSAHIWICRSLARSRRRIFYTKNLPSLELAQRQSKLTVRKRLLNHGKKAKDSVLSEPTVQTVGICTDSVAVGDIVVALDGLTQPSVIIRPSGSGFRLVSPAFVSSKAKEEPVNTPVQLLGELEEFVLH